MPTFLQNLPIRVWVYLGFAVVAAVLMAVLYVRRRRRSAPGKAVERPVATRTAEPRIGKVSPAATAVPTPEPAPSVVMEEFRKPAPAHSSPRTYPTVLPKLDAADTPVAGFGDRVFGGLTPVFAAFLPETADRSVETRQELLCGGYFKPHAYENLQATRYLLMFAGLVAAGLMLIVAPARWEPYAVGALIGLPLLGWAMPRLVVKGRAKERRVQIERGMPDMLDMLNMCVSQGMTMPAALKRVGEELPKVHPALNKELQILSDQARIGTMDQALENFRRRMDVPEVHSFCNLMLQTERMGTSVSYALQEYSDNMRASLQQRADEKGNRAAFKLLFPTVLCLMPAIYIVLLGPAMVSLQRYTEARANNSQLQRARDILGTNAADANP